MEQGTDTHKQRGWARPLILYLGSSWVLLESMSFFVDRYGLPVELLNLTLILLIFLLPFFVLYLFIRNVFSKLFIGLSIGYAAVAIAILFTQFSIIRPYW